MYSKILLLPFDFNNLKVVERVFLYLHHGFFCNIHMPYGYFSNFHYYNINKLVKLAYRAWHA